MVARSYRLIRNSILAGFLWLASPALGQLLVKPDTPQLNRASLDLILSFEVGDATGQYYNRYLIHPEWPGASSGVTWGVGYDGGYNSKAVILKDWELLEGPEERLARTAGVTGSRAKAILPQYRDIKVPYAAATIVFNDVTLSRFWSLTRRTFPGFDQLRPNAQGALVSLVFNRGSDLTGERRREMRRIKELVPHQDYAGMAGQFRSMKRIWRGTDVGDGLIRRREAEAKLMETP